jgi:exo-beta-1,3-glucanase (GH17 family)
MECAQYRFWVRDPNGAWSLLRDWGAGSHTWSTAGLTPGMYTLRGTGRAPGAPAGQAYADVAYELTSPPPCSGVALSASPGSPQTVGTSVSLGAIGTNCAEYRFWQQDPGGSWSLLRDWGSAATHTWTTAGLASGPYVLRASGRAVGAPSGQAYADIPYALSAPPACTGVSLGASPASPRSVGSSVSLTAGGTNCAEYRFWQRAPNGTWTELRTWGVGSHTWNTAGLTPGAYTLRASGRAAGAPTGQAWVDIPFMVRSVYVLNGLDFSPYMDGQDPNQRTPVPEEQVLARLAVIAPHTEWVRSFGCGDGLEHIPPLARQMGLKVAAGAWLGRDLAVNQQQVACLIGVLQRGEVDLAIVGSEVLLRSDLLEAQLIGYIDQVRQAAGGVPVTTADTYGALLAHPNVIAAIDLLLVNYYGYWEGVAVDQAIATLHMAHQDVLAAAGSKPVWVSETGWPTCGSTRGDAVPSPANSAGYFLNFVSWARATNTPYFYFEAFDEAWKAYYGEGPAGACWGVWDRNGLLKPGMQTVFNGQTVADNWSYVADPIGGPGTPSIAFTSVPAYGTFEDLKGQVQHVSPLDHRVVVYIQVPGGGWWVKPTAANPVTSIRPDGRWTADVTTGGIDHLAIGLVAYLIPRTYSPPVLLGARTLPAALEQVALAKAEATRTP